MALLRMVLYLILIPVMICGAVVGASLELGATWDDAFKNISVIKDATIETYETHFDLAKLSISVLFQLEGERAMSDLELVNYIAEVRSRTSDLSAKVDRALSDYLKRQVKQQNEAKREQTTPVESITFYDLAKMSLLGAFTPLLVYWFICYLLTRIWLTSRARETLHTHLVASRHIQG